jgi:DNA (cytosine-5)-methyltransferase 1
LQACIGIFAVPPAPTFGPFRNKLPLRRAIRMYTFYEFFAGGGMARTGLGDPWHCLFANDICSKKAKAYAANWGSERLVVRDVFDLTSADLPAQADLVWSSFPCQDLSLAGQRAGLGGERSGAFWGFWTLMRRLQRECRKPRLIILENVYGAITSHGGRDFEAIAHALADAGYRFGAMLIDAVHFLPQSRSRLFFVAVDERMPIPESLHGWTATPSWHPEAVIRAHNRLPQSEQSKWLWWSPPAPADLPPALEDLIEREPTNVAWHSTEHTAQLLTSMSDVNRRKVIMAQADGKLRVGTIYRRTRNGIVRAEVRFDGISGCLRTPTGGSSRQTLLVVEGERVRSRLLSAREAARLMGLPDSYKLPEKYNDAYHLAGDGVAVPVVRHLAKTLLEPILAMQSMRNIDRAAA